MPIYSLKCSNCGEEIEMFFGKIFEGDETALTCKKCGHLGMRKIPSPVASANFSSGSSRKSLKTRTGVGEIQFQQGAKKIIDKANKK